jgi:hypothetical protein
MVTTIITEGAITAVIDGRSYTIARDNPVYHQVRQAIVAREPDATIADMFRTADAVKRFTGYKIEIECGELFYNGEVVHNVVVDKIFSFMTDGLPPEPLINFLDRLMKNPSKRSIEELYLFLEANNLPITEEGLFLAFKGVREDYTDQYSGKFSNRPGITNSMPRQKVDDDFRRLCSYGFHVGSLEYAVGFGPKCVIVQVDPANVVSVPEGNHTWKLRTSKYKVLCDYQGPLPRPLYHVDADPEEVWDVYSENSVW